MRQLPPLNDNIAFALARIVDDAQVATREPSHSDIEFCITSAKLTAGDPKAQGQVVGKAKRVRAVNTLRNKEGTGHGRPWLPSVSAEEARHAVQVMGTIAELLIRTLKQRT